MLDCRSDTIRASDDVFQFEPTVIGKVSNVLLLQKIAIYSQWLQVYDVIDVKLLNNRTEISAVDYHVIVGNETQIVVVDDSDYSYSDVVVFTDLKHIADLHEQDTISELFK